MKAIDLGNGLILKERMFQLERDSNMFRMEFLLYPKFGETYTRKIQNNLNTPFVIQIDGDADTKLWKGIKDTASVEFTKWVYNTIYAHYNQFRKAREWDKKREKNPSDYLEEKEIFVDGVKTVQKVPMMNPHIIEVQKRYETKEDTLLKKNQFPLYMVESMINSILDQEVLLDDIKLIDIR